MLKSEETHKRRKTLCHLSQSLIPKSEETRRRRRGLACIVYFLCSAPLTQRQQKQKVTGGSVKYPERKVFPSGRGNTSWLKEILPDWRGNGKNLSWLFCSIPSEHRCKKMKEITIGAKASWKSCCSLVENHFIQQSALCLHRTAAWLLLSKQSFPEYQKCTHPTFSCIVIIVIHSSFCPSSNRSIIKSIKSSTSKMWRPFPSLWEARLRQLRFHWYSRQCPRIIYNILSWWESAGTPTSSPT